MTKKDIVMKIAEETGLKQIDVKLVVQKTLDHITNSVAAGKTVELRNFGVFKVKTRKPRIGRNPKTGVTVSIPERKVVTFKSGMIMKARVVK
ncbi:MAG: integration host factor subunit beta [Candidatus Omnitrophica bacterium]|nr:integration host factor subunit beta [Candidatus Omnitrophota bacterium]